MPNQYLSITEMRKVPEYLHVGVCTHSSKPRIFCWLFLLKLKLFSQIGELCLEKTEKSSLCAACTKFPVGDANIGNEGLSTKLFNRCDSISCMRENHARTHVGEKSMQFRAQVNFDFLGWWQFSPPPPPPPPPHTHTCTLTADKMRNGELGVYKQHYNPATSVTEKLHMQAKLTK